MTRDYEPLALKCAPELFYMESDISFRDISPEDMKGFYWRAAESSVSWADVCIQYIVYFKQQRWDSSILDKFLGKPVGSHPNDFVPIFLYLKDKKPVRVVFDILHYDLVGKIDDPTPYLHKEGGPQFLVLNYYRGLMPLKKVKEYKTLKGNLTLLDSTLLKEWYKGRTFEGGFLKEAEFVIRNKLDNPFQEITTFRDRSDLAGTLIEAVILAFKLRGWPRDYEIREQRPGRSSSFIAQEALKYFRSRSVAGKTGIEDVVELVTFIQNSILGDRRMLEYLVLPESGIGNYLRSFAALVKKVSK